MRLNSIYIAGIIGLAAARIQAQGTFQNLNFESGDLTPVPPGQYGGEVSISAALPGWTGYLGNSSTSQILQNDLTIGAASIDILGPDWTGPPGIIDGNYSVYLQPGGSVNFLSASIAQTGTIPQGMQQLLFDAWQPMYAIPFTVSFAGNVLSPYAISSAESPSGQVYTVYGANIGEYAGDTGQLAFTVSGNDYNTLLLDDISFSTTPEPSPIALAGIGGLIFATRKWFTRR